MILQQSNDIIKNNPLNLPLWRNQPLPSRGSRGIGRSREIRGHLFFSPHSSSITSSSSFFVFHSSSFILLRSSSSPSPTMPTFKSPLPHVDIPEVDLYTFFFDRTPAPPASKRCLIDGATGDVITYGQLKSRVDRVASGLYHVCGIREYDVVGIFAPNHIEYPLAVFGAHKLGACVTTANPTYTVDELRFQLVDAAPRVLFTLPELLQTALQAAKGSKVEKIFVFGPQGAKEHGVRTLRELESSGSAHVEKAVIKDVKKRTCFLCYSSGTTGE